MSLQQMAYAYMYAMYMYMYVCVCVQIYVHIVRTGVIWDSTFALELNKTCLLVHGLRHLCVRMCVCACMQKEMENTKSR